MVKDDDWGREIVQNLNRNVMLEDGARGYFLFVNETMPHVCNSLADAKEAASNYMDTHNVLKIELYLPTLPRQGFLYNHDTHAWDEVQPNNSFKPKPLRGSA